jgi:hypothetical protein
VSDGEFPVPGEVGEKFLCPARFPKNLAFIDNPSGKGVAVGICGDSMEVSLRIDMGAIAVGFKRFCFKPTKNAELGTWFGAPPSASDKW